MCNNANPFGWALESNEHAALPDTYGTLPSLFLGAGEVADARLGGFQGVENDEWFGQPLPSPRLQSPVYFPDLQEDAPAPVLQRRRSSSSAVQVIGSKKIGYIRFYIQFFGARATYR